MYFCSNTCDFVNRDTSEGNTMVITVPFSLLTEAAPLIKARVYTQALRNARLKKNAPCLHSLFTSTILGKPQPHSWLEGGGRTNVLLLAAPPPTPFFFFFN